MHWETTSPRNHPPTRHPWDRRGSRVGRSPVRCGSALPRRDLVSLLAQESGGDITHVRLLELVVLAPVAVDTNKVKGFYYGVQLEAHIDKAVNEILAVSLVPVQ